MGTWTVAVDDSGYTPVDVAAGYRVRAVLTGSSSYATGGDTVSGSLFGVGNIRKILIDDGPGGLTAVPVVSTTAPPYVTKIQVFLPTGVEFTAASSLTTTSWQCEVTASD